MSPERRPRVLIVGDWDADGVIAAAEINYSQETLGVFPVRGKAEVELRPAGPRSFQAAVSGGCWDYLIILDIPFTQDVESGLDALFNGGCKPKVYYFDHHRTTLEKASYIEEKYNAVAFVGVSPTSILVKSFLESQGVKLTPRLKDLVASLAVLESGGWLSRQAKGVSEGVIKVAASISKTVNQTKDLELWRKYVKWASSVLPFEPSPLPKDEDIVAKGLQTSMETDQEVKEAARTLAMEARTIGFVKFVDARGRWSKSGASALASAIYRITKMTTALLVSKGDSTNILIVRGSHGDAMKLVEELYRLGVIEDVGGHENIALGRLKPGIGLKELEDALRRASLSLR
ncbi:MAG: phosphoesterase [Acidilobus sp.]